MRTQPGSQAGGRLQLACARRAGEDEGQAQRQIIVPVEEGTWQTAQIRRHRQRLDAEVEPGPDIADIGPERTVERILAITRIMANQAQVELVVTRQEQRRIDRNGDVLTTGFRRGQSNGADHFAVQQHDQLAEIAEHGRRPGEVQRQAAVGHHLVAAHTEGNADFAARAGQADRHLDLQVAEAEPLLLHARCGGGCQRRGRCLCRLREGVTAACEHQRSDRGQAQQCGRSLLGGFRRGGQANGLLLLAALRAVEAKQALEGHIVDHDDIPERVQGRNRLAGGSGLPGIGTAHHRADKVTRRDHVQFLEAQIDLAPIEPDHFDRDRQLLVTHRQRHIGDAPVAQREVGRHGDRGTAHRNVDRRRVDHIAIGHVEGDRQFGDDADIFARLPRLPRDRNGGDQDDQAEHGPDDVQHQRIGLDVEQMREEDPLHDRQPDAEDDEADADQVGAHRRQVEIGPVEQAALVRHVELALARLEEGHDRRARQVKGQDRLVDFAPERPAIPALRIGRRGHRTDQMRQRIGEDQRGRGMDDILTEDQIGKRAGQEDDARQRKLEMQHRVQVAKPLLPIEAAPEQRIVDPQDLGHAARPADALADMQHQPLGRETRGQARADIGGIPAHALQLQCGMRILCHRLAGKAVGLGERIAPDDGAGTAEEGRVPQIVAGLDRTVEQIALARQIAHRAQIALGGVGRIEMMRRLHQRQLGILLEPADGHLQEGSGRHMVAVEDGDQFAIGLLHRRIEVASLGMKIVAAGQIAAAGLARERLKLGPAPVIQDEDAETVGGIIHVHRREHGVADDLQAFIIGRDIDVDAGPLVGFTLDLDDFTVERPAGLQEAQHQDQPGIDFGQIQARSQQKLCQGAELQRFGGAPEHVAGRYDHRQDRQHQQRTATAHPPQYGRAHDGDAGKDPLRFQIERHGDRQQGEQPGQHQQSVAQDRLPALHEEASSAASTRPAACSTVVTSLRRSLSATLAGAKRASGSNIALASFTASSRRIVPSSLLPNSSRRKIWVWRDRRWVSSRWLSTNPVLARSIVAVPGSTLGRAASDPGRGCRGQTCRAACGNSISLVSRSPAATSAMKIFLPANGE